MNRQDIPVSVIEFSSPYGDIWFSMKEKFVDILRYQSFRPLTGIYGFQLHGDAGKAQGYGHRFSPPYGDIWFSMSEKSLKTDRVGVFVPLRGYMVFNGKENSYETEDQQVFVPLRGYMVFNPRKGKKMKTRTKFSSPYGVTSGQDGRARPGRYFIRNFPLLQYCTLPFHKLARDIVYISAYEVTRPSAGQDGACAVSAPDGAVSRQ